MIEITRTATLYEVHRSHYGTWIVRRRRDGERLYETTNRTKAQGVCEYLNQQPGT